MILRILRHTEVNLWCQSQKALLSAASLYRGLVRETRVKYTWSRWAQETPTIRQINEANWEMYLIKQESFFPRSNKASIKPQWGRGCGEGRAQRWNSPHEWYWKIFCPGTRGKYEARISSGFEKSRHRAPGEGWHIYRTHEPPGCIGCILSGGGEAWFCSTAELSPWTGKLEK